MAPVTELFALAILTIGGVAARPVDGVAVGAALGLGCGLRLFGRTRHGGIGAFDRLDIGQRCQTLAGLDGEIVVGKTLENGGVERLGAATLLVGVELDRGEIQFARRAALRQLLEQAGVVLWPGQLLVESLHLLAIERGQRLLAAAFQALLETRRVEAGIERLHRLAIEVGDGLLARGGLALAFVLARLGGSGLGLLLRGEFGGGA